MEERRYTEADLEARRLSWVQSDMAVELGKVNGRLDSLPSVIEGIARKIYTEQRREETRLRWQFGETLSVIVQGIVAAGIGYLVFVGATHPLGH